MYDLSVSWACREWEQLGITACKSLFKYLLCHLAVGWILDFFDFVLYLKKKNGINKCFTKFSWGFIQVLYNNEPSRLPGITIIQVPVVFYSCIRAQKPVKLAYQSL